MRLRWKDGRRLATPTQYSKFNSSFAQLWLDRHYRAPGLCVVVKQRHQGRGATLGRAHDGLFIARQTTNNLETETTFWNIGRQITLT